MMFCCPLCRSSLLEENEALLCSSCSHKFPIEGVPRFVETIDAGFDQRWAQHPKPQATTQGVFELKTGWSASDLNGKVVLDAGCGCGRFSRVAADWGASVVGADGSEHGILAAASLVPEASFIQADLLRLPLPDNSVDMAFSIGVLHHTSAPQEAFKEMARVLRPGGGLAVWLYVNPGGDGEVLVQNPEVDLAAKMLHDITKTVAPETLHEVFEKYAPQVRDLYDGKWNPLHQVLRVSTSADDEECISDTFDWHCPQYRSGHTNPEISEWFIEAGLVVDRVGEFPVSIRGHKAV